MIHKIKALYDSGQGLSIREITRQLNLSRNTVRNYLHLSEEQISHRQNCRERTKRLDQHRDHIVHLLHTYPRLSAVKVARKLKDKYPSLTVSSRSIRRYVERLRETVNNAQPLYYQPVLDQVPGLQCQVDGGELRGVQIGGIETIVYFVVFVLSYSRLMYVALSPRPIDTGCFIRMHDAALRYFGGCPAECVYDQTRLVVLHEQYRELSLNPRFNEYATHAGFAIRACEGYDPESKGKVEAGVKYVKNNGLYGETFADGSALEAYVADWLEVANARCHGTTGRGPREHFEADERAHLKPYNTPPVVHPDGQERATRKADKTGLISWQANKYSVPMAYQRSAVGVQADAQQLRIYDLDTGQEIACHDLALDKGKVVQNRHHYRDLSQRIEALEAELVQQVGTDTGPALCALLKKTSPKIYKDQLAGACKIVQAHGPVDETLWPTLLLRPRLTAKGLQEYLVAYKDQPQRLQAAPLLSPLSPGGSPSGALERYAALTNPEVTHEWH